MKILAKNAALATVSSSGAEFSLLHVSFAEKEMWKLNLNPYVYFLKRDN